MLKEQIPSNVNVIWNINRYSFLIIMESIDTPFIKCWSTLRVRVASNIT